MQREAIFTVIKQQMEDIIDDVDIKSIDESKSMADYGADSLEIVEVVSRSMKELNLRVRRTSLSEAKTLGDLVDIFEKASQESTETVG